MLSSCNTMLSIFYNIVYNVSCSPNPTPGRLCWTFIKIVSVRGVVECVCVITGYVRERVCVPGWTVGN